MKVMRGEPGIHPSSRTAELEAKNTEDSYTELGVFALILASQGPINKRRTKPNNTHTHG